MKIIEISALENGAHRNQNGGISTPPKGWAVVPDNMETPNFPFGEIEVEEINGVMTVTKWVAVEVPETPEEPEEPENPGTPTDSATWKEMAQAITEGVNEV